ncbi:MAG: thioesterase [Deltaproteobacteria bacterium]|nr:thioesterase [Deltaproteobacteria bacterium]
MNHSLSPGLQFEFTYTVPPDKTVPHLLPESPEFGQMPPVLASGYMVGLIEWACIRAINPHLNWPAQQTVGVGFHLSHLAATPPGLTVRVQGTLTEVQGRRLTFAVVADDGVDKISEGTHDRFIIDAAKFSRKAAAKGEAPR